MFLARIITGLLRFVFLMGSPLVPFRLKLLPVLALAYLIWPRDLIFDTIPFFGLLDDVGVMSLLFNYFMRRAEPASRGEGKAPRKDDDKTVKADFKVLDDEDQNKP